MAERKRLRQTEETRKKIQTTQLIKRLTKHALSDEEIMTASQVNAIKILLGKTLPDIKALELSTGESGLVINLESDAKKL